MAIWHTAQEQLWISSPEVQLKCRCLSAAWTEQSTKKIICEDWKCRCNQLGNFYGIAHGSTRKEVEQIHAIELAGGVDHECEGHSLQLTVVKEAVWVEYQVMWLITKSQPEVATSGDASKVDRYHNCLCTSVISVHSDMSQTVTPKSNWTL